MENSVFPRADVRDQKQKFIEARLNSDAYDPTHRERIAGLIDRIAKTPAQPTYVVIDPKTEVEIARFNNAEREKGEFTEFLTFAASATP